jgi:phosphate:Na+ symporter
MKRLAGGSFFVALLISIVIVFSSAGCSRDDVGDEGVVNLKKVVTDNAGKELTIYLYGDLQDGSVTDIAGQRLRLLVKDKNDKPVPQINVLFQLIGTEGSQLISGIGKTQRLRVYTNKDGEAAVAFQFGKNLGVYKVEAVSFCADGVELFRHVFRLTGIDYQKLFFGLFGGLGLFLFGMGMMTDALQHLAGERLKYFLEVLTRNKLIGLGVGTFVTAIVQSSSATTVMLVGFLNAGLMTLEQTIPIIFGANIGTTITGQMIAFNLGQYALPAIGVAFLMMVLSKKKRNKHIGEVLMGFGLLFLGMGTMSGVFKPISASPLIADSFMAFGSSPGLCFLVGLFFTVVLQSSSATVGLTITMAASGLLTFHAAVPIIFGTNVGTTITAVLASLNANTAAKRAACVHVAFNLLGSLIMLISLGIVNGDGEPLYYVLVNSVTSGNVFAGENVARHLANAHTIFNVVFGFAFLPFSGLFALGASKLIKGSDTGTVNRLEEHILETPGLAMDMVILEFEDMTRVARSMLVDAMIGFMKRDDNYFLTLPEREERVDTYQANMTNYLVRLSQGEMSETVAAMFPRLLHSVNDIERVADICENIMELGERVINKKLPFSELADEELLILYGKVLEMCDRLLLCLTTSDWEQAKVVRYIEADVNHLEDSYRRNHIRRMKEGDCNPVSGVIFLELIGHLEKIADHLDNVGEAFSVHHSKSVHHG